MKGNSTLKPFNIKPTNALTRYLKAKGAYTPFAND